MSRVSLLFSFLFLTHLSFAQDETRITYQCNNQSLRELLHQWEKDYSIAFAFQADIINDIYVSINIKEENLLAGELVLIYLGASLAASALPFSKISSAS